MKRNFENFSFHENEMNAPNVFNTSNEKKILTICINIICILLGGKIEFLWIQTFEKNHGKKNLTIQAIMITI